MTEAAGVVPKLPDGEELEDSFLDFIEAVMIGIQHLTRLDEAGLVFRLIRPGHRDQPIQVGAGDHVLRGIYVDLL